MGKTIEIQAADGHRFSAYEAGAENAARHLLVIQEIFGVNRHMREVADLFAQQGFRVLAPALFDRAERGAELGYTAADSVKGRELRAAIPEAATLADIEAAARHLGGKTGIVGYCWGGTVAWWGATRSSLFGAAVSWYGGGIAAAKNETPHCPVQLHFGEKDASIPMPSVEEIRQAHPALPIFVYPGAQHGFGCDERPSYSAKDTELAHARTLEFLTAHL